MDPVTTGTVVNADVTEASGIAVSRKYPGTLWMHNDSGGDAIVYATDFSGNDLGGIRGSRDVGGVGSLLAAAPRYHGHRRWRQRHDDGGAGLRRLVAHVLRNLPGDEPRQHGEHCKAG